MGVSLMRYLHPQISTVEDISPRVNYTTLTIQDTLIEIQAIQIEGHRAYTQSGEPDADHWPGSKEEVQRTGVIKGSIFEK